MYRIAVVFFFSALLSGCGTPTTTPEALIQYAKDDRMMSSKDTFEVKQPVTHVTAVLKERSAACLNRQVTSTWTENQNGWVVHKQRVTVFTPRVVAGKERTRMTLQYKYIQANLIQPGDPPPEGYYLMVVDAYPVDKNTTRVEAYHGGAYKGAFTALKPWLTQANSGCPDLTN